MAIFRINSHILSDGVLHAIQLTVSYALMLIFMVNYSKISLILFLDFQLMAMFVYYYWRGIGSCFFYNFVSTA